MAKRVKQTTDSRGFIYPKGVNQIIIEGVVLDVRREFGFIKGSIGYTGYDSNSSKGFIGFQFYEKQEDYFTGDSVRDSYDKAGLVQGAIITVFGDIRYENVQVKDEKGNIGNKKQPIVNIRNYWSNFTDVEIQKLIDARPEIGENNSRKVNVGNKYVFQIFGDGDNETFDIMYKDTDVATDVDYKEFYDKYYGICAGNPKKSVLIKQLEADKIEIES